jgi:3'(2'), 5'-bisphosphate nucleotidase
LVRADLSGMPGKVSLFGSALHDLGLKIGLLLSVLARLIVPVGGDVANRQTPAWGELNARRAGQSFREKSMVETRLLEKLLPACVEIAVRAGGAIRQIASESLDVEKKQDGSPLTRADRAGHDTILAGLSALEPRLAVLSEEGSQAGLEDWRADPYWLVDPLDGTKEFIAGRDEYTVNIALVEDAMPILGVIYLPAQDVCYYAARSLGALRKQADAPPRRLKPSQASRPRSAVASRSHLSEQTRSFLERNCIEQFIQSGSSIKICAVAEGKADIYPRHGPTCLWDTGAGAAIAREAGCRVIDLEGQDLRYDPAQQVLVPGFIVVPGKMEFQM